jgi:hypothetical protein
MLRRQRPYADRIWSLDTVIKCSKMSSIAPVRLACFHAICLYMALPFFTERRVRLSKGLPPQTKDFQYLAQPFRLYCICATAMQYFTFNRYGYGSLQNLLFSKLLCSLIPLVFTFSCTTVLPVLSAQ